MSSDPSERKMEKTGSRGNPGSNSWQTNSSNMRIELESVPVEATESAAAN